MLSQNLLPLAVVLLCIAHVLSEGTSEKGKNDDGGRTARKNIAQDFPKPRKRMAMTRNVVETMDDWEPDRMTSIEQDYEEEKPKSGGGGGGRKSESDNEITNSRRNQSSTKLDSGMKLSLKITGIITATSALISCIVTLFLRNRIMALVKKCRGKKYSKFVPMDREKSKQVFSRGTSPKKAQQASKRKREPSSHTPGNAEELSLAPEVSPKSRVVTIEETSPTGCCRCSKKRRKKRAKASKRNK